VAEGVVSLDSARNYFLLFHLSHGGCFAQTFVILAAGE
jgi:hypothetical protein